MIVRECKNQTEVSLGAQIKGRRLVLLEDNVGYWVNDANITAGTVEEHILNMEGEEFHHIYYCINGSVRITIKGTNYDLNKDCLLAVPAFMDATLTALEDSWLMFTYCKPKADSPVPDQPVFFAMSELLNSDRDVDWGNGHSRRFLLQKDGFGLTITNTWLYENTRSSMEYKNHFETCFYIEGKGKYIWDRGQKEISFDVSRNGDGISLLLDQHDAHEAVIESHLFGLCVFCPALVGNERHNLHEESSSY